MLGCRNRALCILFLDIWFRDFAVYRAASTAFTVIRLRLKRRIQIHYSAEYYERDNDCFDYTHVTNVASISRLHKQHADLVNENSCGPSEACQGEETTSCPPPIQFFRYHRKRGSALHAECKKYHN